MNNGRRAKTIFSVDDMFRYSDIENPTDRIYITDRTADSLTDFLAAVGRSEPGGKNLVIDPDVLFAGLLRFRDCEIIWLSDDTEQGDVFRIVLFPQYMNLLSKADDSVVIFGFLRIGGIVVPLGVQKGDAAIGFGDIFFANGTSADSGDVSLTPDGIPFKKIMVGIMAIWYALEIAAIDPMTRDLFAVSFPDPENKDIRCRAVNGDDIYSRINELNRGDNNG